MCSFFGMRLRNLRVICAPPFWSLNLKKKSEQITRVNTVFWYEHCTGLNLACLVVFSLHIYLCCSKEKLRSAVLSIDIVQPIDIFSITAVLLHFAVELWPIGGLLVWFYTMDDLGYKLRLRLWPFLFFCTCAHRLGLCAHLLICIWQGLLYQLGWWLWNRTWRHFILWKKRQCKSGTTKAWQSAPRQ